MPANHSDALDASLVSISKQTERSETVQSEVLQALGLLPVRFKEQLASFGVRIILAPTILEILPSLKVDLTECFGVDQTQCEEYARSWPVLYEPPSKTIYIGEKWDGYKGNTVKYNVLNRCAFAFQKISDLATSADLLIAINEDFDSVPGDLMPMNVSDPGEFYAAMFAIVVMLDSSEHDGNWMNGMTLVFPRTAAFVQKTLKEFR